MQSNRARAAIGVATVAVIVVLFIVLSGGDDNNSTTTTTNAATTPTTTGGTQTTTTPAPPPAKTIVVKGGKPVGGVQKLEYKKDDLIRFVVNSDVSDEVHVHGYDIPKDVTAGGSVSFRFPAKLEGVFEVELESRKEQIAELRVNP
jgi:hypothetical protein